MKALLGMEGEHVEVRLQPGRVWEVEFDGQELTLTDEALEELEALVVAVRSLDRHVEKWAPKDALVELDNLEGA